MNNKVTLIIEFYQYIGYLATGMIRAHVSGQNLLDALKNMVDHMGLSFDSEYIEDNNLSESEIINHIKEINGQNCDYIVTLINSSTDEVFIENRKLEENWDD